MSRANPQSKSTTDHKANMGIRGLTKKALDAALPYLMKDLMIAMNFVPGPRKVSYRETDFLPIAESMRGLRPACNQLQQHWRQGIMKLVSRISKRLLFIS